MSVSEVVKRCETRRDVGKLTVSSELSSAWSRFLDSRGLGGTLFIGLTSRRCRFFSASMLLVAADVGRI